MEKCQRNIDDLSPNELERFVRIFTTQVGKENNCVEAVHLLLSGQIIVEDIKTWKNEDADIIVFSVVFDGTDGPGWIRRFESQGITVAYNIKQKLLSSEFKPSLPGTLKKLVVIKEGYTRKGRGLISKEVKKRNLINSDLETLCLVREKFSARQINAMCGGLLVIPNGEDTHEFMGINASRSNKGVGLYSLKSYECDFAGKLFEVQTDA